MNSALVLYWFDATGKDNDELEQTAKKITDTDRGKPIYCGACGHLVSYEKERISIAGQHNHTCTNPADIVYHIGCFRHAPGCSVVGPATVEHTWFTGYRWQIAVCANCGEHLGWFFQNGSEFYGLITVRLVSRY